MTILFKIPESLQQIASTEHVEGVMDVEEIQVGFDSYKLENPAKWSLDITNTGSAFLLSGSITAEVRAICARCTEEFDLYLEGEVVAYYVMPETDVEETGLELDDDEFEFVSEDGVIDFEPALKAALIYDLPMVPLHDKNCLGLCSQCGKNLNEGNCDCTFEEDEDFSKNPFAVLKNLKFDNEK